MRCHESGGPGRAGRLSGFVIGLAVTLLAPSAPSRAETPSPDTARQFVLSLLDEAHRIGADTQEPELLDARYRDLIRRNLQLDDIARYTVGTYWAGMTPDERDRYMAALSQRVVDEVSGSLLRRGLVDFAILDSREIEAGDMLVASRLTDRRARLRDVHWRLRWAPEGFRFVDVLIDGISLARSHRSEFTSVLRQNGGDVDALLERLHSRPAGAGGTEDR